MQLDELAKSIYAESTMLLDPTQSLHVIEGDERNKRLSLMRDIHTRHQKIPIVNVFRFLRPDLWRKLIIAPPFDATLRILQDRELAVASSTSRDAVKMAHSVAELDGILNQAEDQRPIAIIHAVEGVHSLGYEGATDEEVLQH